ncbi:MAG TPA: hypothetical protein VD858_18030, partial [Reyranella sp.]|nr:hypothetical protein [Reyranella sp.]
MRLAYVDEEHRAILKPALHLIETEIDDRHIGHVLSPSDSPQCRFGVGVVNPRLLATDVGDLDAYGHGPAAALDREIQGLADAGAFQFARQIGQAPHGLPV